MEPRARKYEGNRRTIGLWIPVGAIAIVILAVLGWNLYTSRTKSMLTEQLVQAIHRRDLHGAEIALNGGADPDGATTIGIQFTSWREFLQLVFGPRRKEREWTPLRLAVQFGQTEMAKLLLRHGARTVNTPGRNNEKRDSLLMSAIYLKDSELVRMLLERGAHVNVTNWIQCTPAHYAVYANKPGILEMILARGADPNAADEQKRTLLQGAAGSANGPDMIRILLKWNADINLKGQAGWTSLHVSAMFGKAESARTLIDAGAKVNTVSRYGDTPLQSAQQRNHPNLVRILKQAGAK